VNTLYFLKYAKVIHILNTMRSRSAFKNAMHSHGIFENAMFPWRFLKRNLRMVFSKT